jgi:hypothetical protein
MAKLKGTVVPKYVRKVCGEYYEGQRDPLYSVSSTGRVYGREHAGDCYYNLKLDSPQLKGPEELERVIQWFSNYCTPFYRKQHPTTKSKFKLVHLERLTKES